MNIPKVFITYSHDSIEHKKWVLELAIRLRNNGIDAILDQFELKPGDDLPYFMETNLESADRVIMVCSERYVEKANKGEGGVGYEKMILTSTLLKKIDENKIIPLIKQNGSSLLPTFLKSKLYINFSKQDDYEFSFDELIRTIHKSPIFVKPPVGNNPFKEIPDESLNSDINILNETLKVLIELQGIDSFIRTELLHSMLNISLPMLKVITMKLQQKNYIEFFSGYEFISATEKGTLYAYEKALIK